MTTVTSGRVLRGVIAGLLLIWIILELHSAASVLRAGLGVDYRLYMESARRWLEGGSFYPAWQLAGPYVLQEPAVLYPPLSVPFLAAFAFLPWPFWYLPPIIIIGYAVWRLRPGPWTRIGLLTLLAWPYVWTLTLFGNPSLWASAFLALAALGYPTAAFVLLKPSLFPFAAFGVWHRTWWLGLAVVVAMSMLTLPLWSQYITVMLNARGSQASIWYSLKDIPLLAIPLVAWAGRQASRWRGTRVFPVSGRGGTPPAASPEGPVRSRRAGAGAVDARNS